MLFPFSYVWVANIFHDRSYFLWILFLFLILTFLKEYFYPQAHVQKKVVLWPIYFVCLTLSAVFFFDRSFLLYIYPITISLSMAFSFLLSLIYKPTIIESFMMIKGETMTKNHYEYAHKLTMIWIVFLVINAFLSWVSLKHSFSFWTLYNGLISYIFMGILGGGEFIYRKYIKK
ncbi:MAG: hypothetical protein CNLJKLNK_00519 [Holosporales bacterium]